ncbi:MAG: hypothetical protein ACRCXA_07185 [Peptostreptococcaceae bacterium]
MKIDNIGVVVENEHKEILYYNNSFIIDIDIYDKGLDLESVIENKIKEVVQGKLFKIESFSKKIPKVNLSNEHDSKIMYLVEIYMHTDDSDFMKKEEVLDNTTNIFYKDYFLKYLIRYEKYNELVCSVTNAIFMILYTMFFLDIPLGIRLPDLFNNFWIDILVYVAIPLTILHKFIEPSIVNYLIKYDINEKIFKIHQLMSWTICFILIIAIFLR